MDENQNFTPPPIQGYRVLSTAEIELVNEGKQLAAQVGEYVAKLRGMGQAGGEANIGLDQRWISTGATDIQKGFMCLARGIMQPTNF